MVKTVRRWLSKLLRRSVATQLYPPPQHSLWQVVFPRGGTDWTQWVGDPWTCGVVGSGVYWVARAMLEAPIRYQGGEEWEDHPILQRFERPNELYGWDSLVVGTALSLLVDGNAYWLDTGTEWYYLPHVGLEVRVDQGRLEYAIRVGNGQTMTLPPEMVVHFRYGLNPRNPWLGYSPLQGVLREIATENEAATYSAVLLKNFGVPTIVIVPRDDQYSITPDEASQLEERVRQRFSGERRGSPLIPEIPVDVKQVGFSPEQLVLDKVRSVPAARICSALGLDPIVIGLPSENKTFSNYSEARESAYEMTVVPLQRLIVGTLNHVYREELEPGRLVFDLSKVRVLQGDVDRRLSVLSDLVKSGVLTPEDVRPIVRKLLGEE